MSNRKITDNPLEGITLEKKVPTKSTRGRKKKARPSFRPKSFRLSMDDIDRLKDLVDEVSGLAGRSTITETLLIKALLRLGSQTDPEELLNIIKKIKADA